MQSLFQGKPDLRYVLLGIHVPAFDLFEGGREVVWLKRALCFYILNAHDRCSESGGDRKIG